MRIKEDRERDVITLKIAGNLDTNSSAEFQEALLKSFRNANYVVLDVKECNYVSSAGLRVLLMGQKASIAKNKSMKLINVTEVFMSVLEISGLVDVLTIE